MFDTAFFSAACRRPFEKRADQVYGKPDA